MKTFGLFPTVSLVMLLGGCYTELALTHDEPQVAVDVQSIEIIEPPTTVIMEPIFIPVQPSRPYNPPPVVVAPAATANPQPVSPSRDFGNTRADTNSAVRSSGSTRGG